MVKKILFIVLSVIFIMLGVYSCSEGSNYYDISKIANGQGNYLQQKAAEDIGDRNNAVGFIELAVGIFFLTRLKKNKKENKSDSDS